MTFNFLNKIVQQNSSSCCGGIDREDPHITGFHPQTQKWKNLANWFWKKRVEGQCLSEFHPAESVHHLSSIVFVSFTQWRLLHYLYHYTKSTPCIHMHKKLKKESWRQKVVTQVSGIGNHHTNNDHIVHDPLACKTGTLFLCFF